MIVEEGKIAMDPIKLGGIRDCIRKKTSTFTFGTCTFGSTLSLLEHFSTLSLSALSLLARHFHFWSTFRHFHFWHLHFWLNTFTFGALFNTFHFLNHRSFDTGKRQALSLSALTLLVQHFHFWDTF